MATPDTTMPVEDVRGVFKESVEESLDEADFATEADVHDYLDTRLGKTDDAHPDDANEAGGDEPTEVLPDEELSPEEVRERLESGGVPDEIVEEILEYFEDDVDDTLERLDVQATDEYLASQHERLSKLQAEEEHKKDVDKLARSTLAGVGGSESEEILDATVYADEEGL